MAHYIILLTCIFAVLFGSFDARPYRHRRSLDYGQSYSGRATYYDPGPGACGFTSGADEFVVAIPDALYETQTIGGNPNNNAYCGRQISVIGPLGTVRATIVDRCGSCRGGDLDLSRPAFNQIGDPIDGHIRVTWEFV